jgi:hypothetical protein
MQNDVVHLWTEMIGENINTMSEVLNAVSVEKGWVVDGENLHLFWRGWGVSSCTARCPLLPGVHP